MSSPFRLSTLPNKQKERTRSCCAEIQRTEPKQVMDCYFIKYSVNKITVSIAEYSKYYSPIEIYRAHCKFCMFCTP